MKTKIYALLLVSLAVLLATMVSSCKKNAVVPSLASSAVCIREAATVDTLSQSVSTEKDTVITIKLAAAIKGIGTMNVGRHAVAFAIDTTQMAAYRSQYGSANTLPTFNAVLAFNISTLSDTGATAVELNVVNESRLAPGTTYILPIVIESVDGQAPESLGSGQVLYLLIRTLPTDYGIPIDKTGWSIVSFSSQDTNQYTHFVATNLLDNRATPWEAILAMPQYVVIDMAREYDVKAITFTNWILFSYGGNPTQIRIELSTDGTSWTNNGTYSGGTPGDGALHKLKISPTMPARYIRFTVLQSSASNNGTVATVPANTVVGIAEIGANN